MVDEPRLSEREFRAHLDARRERIEAAIITDLLINQREALEQIARLGEELPDGRVAIAVDDLSEVMRSLSQLTMQASIEASVRGAFVD